MADPLYCLRGATIAIAVWNIIYCFIQFGILGWQFQVVKNIIAEYENRQLPATGAIDGFQARFPGLYQIYTETPERRRANAMYVIIIVCVIFSILNLLTSALLLYAAFKYLKVLIWPWFGTSVPLCIMTTAYAVLWWSGDIFNEQLTMSIFEFVMSVAVNVITIIVVIVFFSRLSGSLISTRPKHSKRRRRKHITKVYLDPNDARRHSKSHHHHHHRSHSYTRPSNPPELQLAPPEPIITHAAPYLALDSAALFTPKPKGDLMIAPEGIPDWRREWPSVPDVQLQRHLKQQRKEEMKRMGYNVPPGPGGVVGPNNKLDFYAPEPDQVGFPWKYKTMNENLRERRETQAERIKKLYYQHWPEDLPNMPMEMRRRMQEEREKLETERNKSKLKGFEDV
ncbi:hypothetical protein CRE_02850 [Caenorhabditis remanei]|uniref:Uncharacterized protein n=1 Tax=Caenorhabditis remanei TaxID=31234 RepID=E3LW81_CAERE|nr:hypothetical protein CRE_02850 [Caenorhabditis remanei]